MIPPVVQKSRILHQNLGRAISNGWPVQKLGANLRVCRLLAQSGHHDERLSRRLLGVKRTPFVGAFSVGNRWVTETRVVECAALQRVETRPSEIRRT